MATNPKFSTGIFANPRPSDTDGQDFPPNWGFRHRSDGSKTAFERTQTRSIGKFDLGSR